MDDMREDVASPTSREPTEVVDHQRAVRRENTSALLQERVSVPDVHENVKGHDSLETPVLYGEMGSGTHQERPSIPQARVLEEFRIHFYANVRPFTPRPSIN